MLDWLAGNGMYMTLRHCMGEDELWIGLLCFFSLSVTLAYFFIAYHAWRKYKETRKKSPMAGTLMSFIAVFVLCALCGYGFNILRLWWPGYRLLVMLLVPLNISSWWFLFKCLKLHFFEFLFSLEGNVRDTEHDTTAG